MSGFFESGRFFENFAGMGKFPASDNQVWGNTVLAFESFGEQTFVSPKQPARKSKPPGIALVGKLKRLKQLNRL
ncbi:MAG: hypothetical protein ACK4Q5_03775 [Saprospiraceae bacterium]